MQNGNPRVTVFYVCALSLKGEGVVHANIILWGSLSPVGEGRAEGIRPHKDLNLDLRSQLNHAVRRDLKLVRRAQGVTL